MKIGVLGNKTKIKTQTVLEQILSSLKDWGYETVLFSAPNEIKDVDFTEDDNLTPIEVDENVFKGWSIAKICCHKVILRDDEFNGYTPYVDSKVIEHIERLAKKSEAISAENAMLSETLDSLIIDIIPSLLG